VYVKETAPLNNSQLFDDRYAYWRENAWLVASNLPPCGAPLLAAEGDVPPRRGRPGSFVQRIGPSLNAHVHVHCRVIDGVMREIRVVSGRRCTGAQPVKPSSDCSIPSGCFGTQLAHGEAARASRGKKLPASVEFAATSPPQHARPSAFERCCGGVAVGGSSIGDACHNRGDEVDVRLSEPVCSPLRCALWCFRWSGPVRRGWLRCWWTLRTVRRGVIGPSYFRGDARARRREGRPCSACQRGYHDYG
jgi:hypothetical protein